MKMIQFAGLRLGATYEDWPEDGERIRQRQRELLAELFQKAAESEASVLISNGDLFDSPTVPLGEVDHVLGLCEQHPKVVLAALPGGRDPWGAYTVYHHLKGAERPNLLVLSPGSKSAREVVPGVWLYALPVDANSPTSSGLNDLVRQSEDGIHVAVAYGNMGRLQDGPEEGMVMVSPSVASHSFDWMALADGGPSEKMGSSRRPATYSGALMSDRAMSRDPGCVWSVRFDASAPEVEAVRIQGIRRIELKVDVTHCVNTSSVAADVRREADSSALVCVSLSGVRPADRPIIGRSLRMRCARDFLGLRVMDESTIGPPATSVASSAAVSALWEKYQTSSAEDRQAWADALMLHASGISDPRSWEEAPWAH